MTLYPAFEKLICEKWGLFINAEPKLNTMHVDKLAANRQRLATHHMERMPVEHGGIAPETMW